MGQPPTASGSTERHGGGCRVTVAADEVRLRDGRSSTRKRWTSTSCFAARGCTPPRAHRGRAPARRLRTEGRVTSRRRGRRTPQAASARQDPAPQPNEHRRGAPAKLRRGLQGLDAQARVEATRCLECRIRPARAESRRRRHPGLIKKPDVRTTRGRRPASARTKPARESAGACAHGVAVRGDMQIGSKLAPIAIGLERFVADWG